MGELIPQIAENVSRVFSLNPKQIEALRAMTDKVSRHTLLLGGSRCLGGQTLVETASGQISLSELVKRGLGFRVRSLSSAGKIIEADAEAPFVKGRARLLHIKLDNGHFFDAHPIHRVIVKRGLTIEWAFAAHLKIGDLVLSSVSLADRETSSCQLRSNSECGLLKSWTSGLRLSERVQGSPDGCRECFRFCGVQPLYEAKAGQSVVPSQDDVQGYKRADCSYQAIRPDAEPSCNPYSVSHRRATKRDLRPVFLCPSTQRHESVTSAGIVHPSFLVVQRIIRTVLGFFRSSTTRSLLSDDRPNKILSASKCPGCATTCVERQSFEASSADAALPARCLCPLDSCKGSLSGLHEDENGICRAHLELFHSLSLATPFGFSKIEQFYLKEAPEEYYDFTVPSTAIYAAGGCFHHNSGKSFLAVRAIVLRALKYPKSRHLMLRLYRVTAEKYLWKQTLKDVIEKCFPDVEFSLNNSRMIVTCPNGSTIWVGGLEEGENSDGLLGSDWNTILFDEANEMLSDGMQKARTRLSLKSFGPDGQICINRSFATVNPTYKTHHLYRTYVEKWDIARDMPMTDEVAALYNWIRINPVDNLVNLSPEYLIELRSLSPANQKRFLDGEWSEEAKDALFKSADINRNRIRTQAELSALKFDKIVVGVDPAVTSGNTSDWTGIVVVGWIRPSSGDRRSSGQYYVLDDKTIKGTPDDWAQAVYDTYTHWHADLVIGEANNGGDLVEKNIRSVSRTIPYKKVWASRGKAIRAQPVAALSERGDLHICLSLPELEGEMIGWNPDSGEKSPNRLDAMVWSVMECLGMKIKKARIIGAV